MIKEGRMYKKYFKRLMDIIFALIIFAGFWWVYLIVGILVRVKLGAPIIFKQQRPGKNGKIFTMYKFRSMKDFQKSGEEEKLIQLGKVRRSFYNERRLTDFGKLLRSTSLDEIPELWNVLKGEMSLVGPRPLLVDYLSRYSPEQARRHEVKSGITGWAQVNGRNAISWEERFRLDVEYVDNYSFFMDLKIIFLTIKKVFCREGVSPEGQTMIDEFMGNEES